MKTARIVKVFIAFMIALLAIAIGGATFYLKQESKRTTYFARTTVNGYDASGKTTDELVAQIEADYSAPTVTINENSEASITGVLADYGYTVDDAALRESVEETFRQQKTDIFALVNSLMIGNDFKVDVPFVFDENVFNSKVSAANLKEPRKASVDAELKFNETESSYYIEPEVYGNEFSDAALQEYVNKQIDMITSSGKPGADMIIEFPTSLYVKPTVLSDDADMNNTMNLYNRYSKAKITYVFGSQTQVLDWSTIKDWIIIDGTDAYVSADPVHEYVTSLAANYNTRYYNRTFHTSLGTDINIEGDLNTYGYTVNEDGEYEQLVADIQANTATEREPVYFSTTFDGFSTPVYFQREGRDDLAGTYVEANLTMQHLWFYKYGELIVESDFVSGCVAKGNETNVGVYPIAYKESPSVLSGQDGNNGYETPVDYWMPFSDGQGLHDATWRKSFGGNIYVTNGSHGCINLPKDVAAAIYNNIEAGTAIIVYK